MSAMAGAYPFKVDFDPPAAQNRLSVLLRFLYVIPIAIVAGIVGLIAGIMTIIAWIVILVTGKYPEGMANFVLGAWRMSVTAGSYETLLTEKYPPFSPSEDLSGYPVRPSGTVVIDGRNRLTVLLRYFMAIPHFIVLAVLGVVGCVVTLIAWVMALVTGSVSEGMHKFLSGWQRWQARTVAYVLLLTDEYPPFSLE